MRNRTVRRLKGCKYCHGKDGKKKDVYVTFQSAFDTAKFIEEERGIYLSVYKCFHGNGWHLTKDNASSEINERKDALFQNNDIPINSHDGTWEYIKNSPDEDSYLNENEFEEKIKKHKPKKNPIIKIECKQEKSNLIITGKIMNIIMDVNIEKIFNINTQNIFCAKLIKNILDGIVDQITLYVENEEQNQFESYTILLKRELVKNNIKKGNIVKLNILGIKMNNIYKWCCNKIL
jgi:hypothetical protein